MRLTEKEQFKTKLMKVRKEIKSCKHLSDSLLDVLLTVLMSDKSERASSKASLLLWPGTIEAKLESSSTFDIKSVQQPPPLTLAVTCSFLLYNKCVVHIIGGFQIKKIVLKRDTYQPTRCGTVRHWTMWIDNKIWSYLFEKSKKHIEKSE
jgi:hypothetical protein